ncbi:hypothetical protein CEXT_674251 [Caerostris extrusa]|uniref:Uncharacterized protein n=1 Tax=Caerostris extrusa TaxID=172846 RepID=A0AAV4XR46_CAEEX|nr:hypothetical protein CEXT_674251 [Caerostris extrusa]
MQARLISADGLCVFRVCLMRQDHHRPPQNPTYKIDCLSVIIFNSLLEFSLVLTKQCTYTNNTDSTLCPYKSIVYCDIIEDRVSHDLFPQLTGECINSLWIAVFYFLLGRKADKGMTSANMAASLRDGLQCLIVSVENIWFHHRTSTSLHSKRLFGQ